MKSLLLTLLAGLALLMPTFAQDTQGFHYQAVVRNASGTAIANQQVSLRFSILDTLNGTILYRETHTPTTDEWGMVALAIGKGTPDTGAFANLDWQGNGKYLQVELDTTGGSNYTDLGTEALQAVPYAKYADRAGNALWEKDSTGSAIFYDGGNVGIGTDNPSAKLHVNGRSVLAGGVKVGNTVASATLEDHMIVYSDGNVAFEGGQIFVNTTSTSGAKGIKLSAANSGGNPAMMFGEVDMSTPNNIIHPYLYFSGYNVGIGTDNPSAKLHVNGRSVLGGGVKVGNTVASPTLEDHMIVYSDGNVAFEGGQIFVNTTSTSGAKGIKLSAANSGGNPAMMFGEVDMSTPNNIIHPYLYFSGYKVGIGTNNPTSALHVNGETTTKCLTITGGCDIIEYVQAAAGEQIEAGEVVVIDPEHHKQVRKATKYRQGSVVGIISGAGGVNPGLALSQEGVLDGDLPLAIAGRVYVKAHGKIRPGDQLTSSDRPGYATRLRGHRGQGAIIGKALTALDGEGLVMVLVNIH